MRNTYTTIDWSDFNLPCIEVHGESFCYEDLYELSGKHGFMTTFNIKDGSQSHSKFGKHITGTISYPPKESEEKAKNKTNKDMLKISCFDHQFSSEIIEDLKHGGLNISDIESILVLPFKLAQEFHETGEKKVPNVVQIELSPAELTEIDMDILQMNLLIRKNNDGIRLTDFEKEELIGIMLALNNLHIDSRILHEFGFDAETVMSNINIRSRYYDVKERRHTLSGDEKEEQKEVKYVITIQRWVKLLQEIKRSGAKDEELSQNKNILKKVFDSVLSFRPHVLLLGETQIYWNVDSYIHIVMRHFREYQIGSFQKGHTPFSYKVEELETLIEKVLGVIKEEYRTHVSNKPESYFKRDGTMAIEFNGDHYTVLIAPDGRLEQFHAW